jgi:hypothetical protein
MMAAIRRRRTATRKLTVRDVKQRAKTAGITLPEDAWEGVTDTMNSLLAPLQAFDTTAERDREPAVIFYP